ARTGRRRADSCARLAHEGVEPLVIEPSVDATVEHGGRRSGTKTEAIDWLERDAAVGRGLAHGDAKLLLGARRNLISARRLAGLGAAELEYVTSGRRAADVVIEGGDPVPLGTRDIERMRDQRLGRRVDVTELLLERMQDRQQRTLTAGMLADQRVGALHIPGLVYRHGVFLGCSHHRPRS